MTADQQWSLLIGFLMPLLIAAVQHRHFATWLRATIAVVSCLIAGVVTVALTNGFDHISATNALSCLVLVVVAGTGTYEHFWKQTGIAPWIEKATSFLPTGEQHPG